MNGVLPIDKPEGWTSFDVIRKLRHPLMERSIGHLGTLDPMATGVLVLLLGNATKAASILEDDDKVYEAEILLGTETDTEDVTGTVLRERPVDISEETFRETAASFIGPYQQIPPMMSAKKQGGRKLYELARKGIETERKPEKRMIHSLEILSVTLPEARFRVHVSKGTYVRSLCRDIGNALKTGGTMKSLRRLRQGRFDLAGCQTLDEVLSKVNDGTVSEIVIPTEELFSEMPVFTVSKDSERFLRNGNVLRGEDFEGAVPAIPDGTNVRIRGAENVFRAVYRYDAGTDTFKVVKMFL